MTEKYSYEIKDGCIHVTDTEQNTSWALCNFTAKIVKEEHYFVTADGEAKIFYHIQGTTQTGEELKTLRVSIEDLDKGKWFRTGWGVNFSLNDLEGPNTLKHFRSALSQLSVDFPRHYVYPKTGVFFDSSGKPKFLFRNGAITAEGIDLTSYCDLHGGTVLYKFTLQINEI